MRKAALLRGLSLLATFGVLACACGTSKPSAAAHPTSFPAPATTTTTTTVVTTTLAPTTIPVGPPYAVASLTVALVDTSRPTVSHGKRISNSRALTTVVWYPRVAGRHPLVIFGHGYDVGPDTYAGILEAWASRGYVIAAPEFPLADPAVAGAAIDENDIQNQPADLRFVTDSLVAAGSPVATRIDPTRVAVAGHSDGAESALGAAIAATPPGEPPYRALIAMSVQQLTGVSHTVNPPMLVTQGDADTINPPSYGYQVYDEGSSPKFLLVIRGGGHLPPLLPGSEWRGGIEAVTESFLDCYVAGDAPVAGIGGGVAGSSLFRFSAG